MIPFAIKLVVVLVCEEVEAVVVGVVLVVPVPRRCL